MQYAAVSAHIQAAVRGRVRAATTVSTTRWATMLAGSNGQSPLPDWPITATTGIEVRENQKAPTGRTSVSRIGPAEKTLITSASNRLPPLSAKETSTASI